MEIFPRRAVRAPVRTASDGGGRRRMTGIKVNCFEELDVAMGHDDETRYALKTTAEHGLSDLAARSARLSPIRGPQSPEQAISRRECLRYHFKSNFDTFLGARGRFPAPEKKANRSALNRPSLA